MEKINFNKQPKAEIEKTSQENEESLNTEEQESGKRENITLEIDGQTIEAVKYYFEYPERIQKETGILGYERTIISSEQLNSLFEESIKKIKEKNKQSEEIWEKLGYNFALSRTIEDKKLLQLLSDGEYPDYSYNHRYSWYTSSETKTRHMNSFKKDFFLGKLFDLERTEEESKYEKYPFSNSKLTTEDFSDINQNISIYDLENKSAMKGNDLGKDYISFGRVLGYKNDIKEGQVYASTTSSGLLIYAGEFFNRNVNYSKEICFGFPFELDHFMKEYMEECFCILKQQMDSRGVLVKNSFADVAEFLLMSRSKMKTLPPLEERKKVENRVPPRGITEDEFNYLNSILEQRGVAKIPDDKADFFGDSIMNITHIVNGYPSVTVERRIPIFIGHPKIPQLSWGHAKYANYMNEKGFNFFKFKHADHLPTKEEMNSSES